MYAFFDSAKALYLSWRRILRIFNFLELIKGSQLNFLLIKIAEQSVNWGQTDADVSIWEDIGYVTAFSVR